MKKIKNFSYPRNLVLSCLRKQASRYSAIAALMLLSVFSNTSFSQITTRTASTPYIGLGYTFVILTNKDASDTYPAISKNFELLKEINLIGGIKFNKSLAIELSPSFTFTNSVSSTGFNFTASDGIQRFYFPQTVSFTSIPINVRAKFYPFTIDPISMVSNIYFMAGGGPTYISEEFNNYVYDSSSLTNFQGTMTSKNSFWKANYIIGVGIGSTAKLGYSFEASYRIIPLDGLKDKPQTTSIAKDLNSINLSAIILFSF